MVYGSPGIHVVTDRPTVGQSSITTKRLLGQCIVTCSVIVEVLDHESLLVQGVHLPADGVGEGGQLPDQDLLGGGGLGQQHRGHAEQGSHGVCLSATTAITTTATIQRYNYIIYTEAQRYLDTNHNTSTCMITGVLRTISWFAKHFL